METTEALALMRQVCAQYHGCAVFPGATIQDHQQLQAALQVLEAAVVTRPEPAANGQVTEDVDIATP